MAPDRLDYFLMLASTAEPDTQGALRDAVIDLVATVRRLQAKADTDPAPAPDDCPTPVLPISGSLGSLDFDKVDDDDGDPEGCV
jgi:hypothetical protein